ncbi:uncharacterized protein CANTADRAFT_46721 [Suhomyces tanzawaensis NRRL Y-17324]|uniref:ER membrane protein complex subunit 7 beta-sandwich domain-containing protein n=1 Tax=Suhomyces tanzawaensis NRRL Y-17324 TaxID=984487 RepID=A0A1E4SNE5_9ASCO|nr:uncharacterized protein CANTADRAFT_46721 [Suhomyces tanzawaensis NRRL Y-17324]ODV81033.1 hypothetical protein CANTADRAFT_46721 [Suhomyces tanzawaensis NRRL Y-17324]
MKLGLIIAGIFQFGVPVLTQGFKADLIDIPTEIDELHKERQVTVVNGDNYPGRIQVDLIPLNSSKDNFAVLKTLVDEKYTFSYDNLHNGVYELLVNSYDFKFTNDRYIITVDDGFIEAKVDPLDSNEASNISIPISFEEPLQIQFSEIRQFYDKSLNSVAEMILNSPFGYIFKSKLYTFMFTVSICIIVAPYFISYFFPDIAEELKEAQAEIAGKKRQAVAKPVAQVPSETKATGSSKSDSNARKRR